jgi:hypothetical protein
LEKSTGLIIHVNASSELPGLSSNCPNKFEHIFATLAVGSTRGLSTRSLDDYALEMVTWKVLAEGRAGTTK